MAAVRAAIADLQSKAGTAVRFAAAPTGMKPVQMRMARAALGWGVREPAEKAGITANTVTRIENGADAKQSTVDAIRVTLERAGVRFITTEHAGLGAVVNAPAGGAA